MPDRIGALFIKNGGDYLHKTITTIPNATCQLGYFPDTWKCDNLRKSDEGSYHNPNSYRSISLYNFLDKTLEKYYCQDYLQRLKEVISFMTKIYMPIENFTTHPMSLFQ